ncbi:MAG: type II toxin-antitoxin system YafQ family toxin [Clostridia bacterium]|nr:type II toxin-antitoxin system YafQ family toxin [Clostridia bacterium]
MLQLETTGQFRKDYKRLKKRGFRECHILPDWLLIYAIKQDKLVLTASRTGTHSDLFGK